MFPLVASYIGIGLVRLACGRDQFGCEHDGRHHNAEAHNESAAQSKSMRSSIRITRLPSTRAVDSAPAEVDTGMLAKSLLPLIQKG